MAHEEKDIPIMAGRHYKGRKNAPTPKPTSLSKNRQYHHHHKHHSDDDDDFDYIESDDTPCPEDNDDLVDDDDDTTKHKDIVVSPTERPTRHPIATPTGRKSIVLISKFISFSWKF
jgi:hypothetical protein